MLPTLAALTLLFGQEAPPGEDAPASDDAPSEVREGPDYNAPWRQGRSRLSLSGGVVGLGGSDDFFLGGGYGYFVVDNLELGIDVLMTFGEQPFTMRVGPSLTFIIPVEAEVQPYLGGFYRHWFITDNALLDVDTLGGRVGVVLRSGGVFLQLGLVVERTVSDCEDDCTAFYPELGFSLTL